MGSPVRKFAHVLERIALAMIGAACGLFVGLHVGATIASLASKGFMLIMMISGVAGFYLGIDTPLPFRPHDEAAGEKVDSAEFLSAVGTFLAASSTLITVFLIVFIVFRETPQVFWTEMIMLAWAVGVMMQIIAGVIARARR
jgi:hypothetical protein